MNLSDLLVIYFAFGAPLSVYRYLDTRGVSGTRRITLSILTFLFWLPFAAGLIRRYLTNASFVSQFVSEKVADSRNFVSSRGQEVLRGSLLRAGCKLSSHDIRVVLERYAGLSSLTRGDATAMSGHAESLFKAAGRKPDELGSICLTRKERRRLEAHNERSRDAFMALFSDLPHKPASWTVVEQGIELARQVGDFPVAENLATLEGSFNGAVLKRSIPAEPSTRGLAMTSPSPSVD